MQLKEDKYSILQKYWKFKDFRGKQGDIVDSVLEGKDTLALMATGGGKSLCYQLPAMLMEGICIVISPLIALMEDQEESLRKRGISVESVHSGKSKKRQDDIYDNCIYGKVKFLFLSPEKFQSKLAVARIKQMQVAFFAIDEAHCISQWGHDFRPQYLQLTAIKDLYPEKAILALTATATADVVSDILTYLNFEKDHKVFKSSFFRPNLSISVNKSSRKNERILEITKRVKGSKIIYARNKRHCKEINQMLLRNAISSSVYHADIPMNLRKERQMKWIQNEVEVMVCTSAFGMGIDKSDVRLVLHYDIPPSLEEYIQEIGRAGRDGKLSYTVLLYNNYDLQELEFHYKEGIPKLSRIREIYDNLGTYLKVARGDGLGQSYSLNMEEFMRNIKSNRVELRSALQTLEKNEFLSLSSSFFTSDKIYITASKSALNLLLTQSNDIAILIKHLLRNYEGLLYGYVNVNLANIVRKFNWTNTHLDNLLSSAKKQSYLKYIHDDGAEKITYLKERLPMSNLLFNKEDLRRFYSAKKSRYEAVISYILDLDCRPLSLLAYFGEERSKLCGICDFCKGAFNANFTNNEYEEAKKMMVSLLSDSPQTLDQLLALWPWNKQAKMKSILQHLVDEELVEIKSNKFKLATTK